MTYANHFVGIGGNDSNDGSTWALRKLTLSNMEAALTSARHRVYIGPGTYREMLTCGVSGPAAYVTGTVSVTQGSKVVTGLSTLWNANAQANDWFQSPVLAHGTDGVTNGTSTFTSAAGNFQASMIGLTIRISTKVAGIISAVASATSITITDTAGTPLTPSAGTALTYDVGPSSPHKVASVDSNTQITLTEAWNDPTLTGINYQVWGHIEYIGDYLGKNTDGVGGVVRLTGSADDIALTRANCIKATSINMRTFSGVLVDGASSYLVSLITSCSNWVIEKFTSQVSSTASRGVSLSGTGVNNTIRNCMLFSYPSLQAIFVGNTSVVDNAGHCFENLIIIGGSGSIYFSRVGGCRVRNCEIYFHTGGVYIESALTVGQTNTVNNCLIGWGNSASMSATAVGEIIENYNNVISCVARSNVTIGANSTAKIPILDSRWFFNLVFNGAGPNSPLQVVSPFDLASDSPLLNVAGLNPPTLDMRGTAIQGAQREWGALEYDSTLKTKRGGGGVSISPASGGLDA